MSLVNIEQRMIENSIELLCELSNEWIKQRNILPKDIESKLYALHDNLDEIIKGYPADADGDKATVKLSENEIMCIMHMFHTCIPAYQDKEQRILQAELIEKLAIARDSKINRGEWG